MADMKHLTDHEDVRGWAASRMGSPAIVDTSPESGVQPLLRIVFDQAAYQDQDRPERPQNAGGYDLVEWSDWFEIFDEKGLALEVREDGPGQRDSAHQIVKREA